eukprot:GHVQ01014036.1.p1 GENE.GHVQ01014036.1~~GHVQ01014036.1.p1  ORF type:complete len:341 (-),score=51.74 GHVQ01014036.1:1190-2212(-)
MQSRFYSLPILFYNLSGEILYVIDKRLHSQNIPPNKHLRVVSNIISAIHDPHLMERLFVPQHLPTLSSMASLLRSVTHSSIMRLNDASMSKLMDISTMAFKYQVIACNSPDHILSVTLNHLHSQNNVLRDAVKLTQQQSTSTLSNTTVGELPSNTTLDTTPPATCSRLSVSTTNPHSLIDSTVIKLKDFYSNFSSWQFYILRSSLCTVLSDTRVRVSMLLQSNLQDPDGCIALNPKSSLPMALGYERPGDVRYMSGGGGDRGGDIQVERTEKTMPAEMERWRNPAGDCRTRFSFEGSLGNSMYPIQTNSQEADTREIDQLRSQVSSGTPPVSNAFLHQWL